jgi:hypothetical protein
LTRKRKGAPVRNELHGIRVGWLKTEEEEASVERMQFYVCNTATLLKHT